MRSNKDPLVWTNALFYINAMLYIHAGFYMVGLMFIGSATLSWFYHHHEETQYKKLDYGFAALALISVFLWVFPELEWPEWLFLIAWLIPSFMVKIEGSQTYSQMNYRFYHVLWHIMVFLGNLFAWLFITHI